MPTNDLLPFATGVGSNVLAQASYAGLAARMTGFQAGTAESAQFNKAFRQSAFVSAMIGQFTMHNAVEDVLDDGNVDSFETKFAKAIKAASSLRRVATGGTADHATATFVPPFLLYTGIYFLLDITTSLNDGADLNVDALGARPLVRLDGTPIQREDAPAGTCLLASYVGTSVQILSLTPYAVQSGTTNFCPKTRVGGTANAITLTMVPPILRYNEGTIYRFIPAFTNTGPTTIAIDGKAVKPLTEVEGTPLAGGELNVDRPAWIQDAGGSFVILKFVTAYDPWSRPLPGTFFAYANPAPAGSTTVGNAVWTKINCPNEQYDVEGWYNTTLSRYTPQKTGFYFIVGDCSFGSNSTLPTTGLRAFMNGTPSFTTQMGDVAGTQYSANGNASRAVVSGITHFNGTTDFIEMYGFQDLVDTSGGRTANNLRWGGWFVGR